jgi:hypothetical protein
MTRINTYTPQQESKFSNALVGFFTAATMVLAGLLSLAAFAA